MITKITRQTGKAYNLPILSLEGYDFLGWWTEKINGTQVYSSDTVEGEITLYAHWRKSTTPENEYKITFDPNYLDGKTLVIPVSSRTIHVDLPNINRVGYELLGWFTDKTNGDKIEEIVPYNIKQNVTYYAHWWDGDDDVLIEVLDDIEQSTITDTDDIAIQILLDENLIINENGEYISTEDGDHILYVEE